MKKGLFTLAILVMAFGNMGFAQRNAHLKSEATANVLKHYGVRNETTMVPQVAVFTSFGSQLRTTYNYDEYDYNLIEEFTEYLIGDEWTDLDMINYEYDFLGNVLEVLIKNVVNGNWVNSQFYSYSYENGVLSEVVLQKWQDGAWINETKEVYNYNGDVTTVLCWDWNGTNWTSNELYTYTYNNESIELLIQYMQSGAWQNSKKLTYTLDFDEHITEILEEVWVEHEWEKRELSVYDFVGGVYNTKKLMYWDEESWSDKELFEFEYVDGNAVHGTCKMKNEDGLWYEIDDNIEMAYGYSAAQKTYFASEVSMTYVDITSLNENTQATNIKVYPVPAENEIFIQAEGFQKAEIYSLTGQKMMESLQTKLNVSALVSGVYLLKVHNMDGNCASQRIVVK